MPNKWNKLNKISFMLSIIPIQLFHHMKISISNPNYNNRQWQSISLFNKFQTMTHIIYKSICHYKQN
ncbi:unnamed protein product [Paramecium primaurelia]|uniref:Uncharacterized protein n=1 Tax=Paramecium primaurelia TaxID=5886 RepID=A0A8S1JTG7_PARPR|nr:unnamed protein product [Paramecium primaurelia]